MKLSDWNWTKTNTNLLNGGYINCDAWTLSCKEYTINIYNSLDVPLVKDMDKIQTIQLEIASNGKTLSVQEYESIRKQAGNNGGYISSNSFITDLPVGDACILINHIVQACLGINKASLKTTPQASFRAEKPCKLCKRNNDVGVASCYWCGTSNPTQ